jgi:CubicO group peptidase (beta-lactamase class C family)
MKGGATTHNTQLPGSAFLFAMPYRYCNYYPAIIGFVLMVIFIWSCSGSDQARLKTEQTKADSTLPLLKLPPPKPLAATEKEHLQNICQAFFDTILLPKGFNGGILVAKNGNIVFEKYQGTAHIPGTDPISDSTPLHIASVTKTFTAAAVLQLWQEGKLNIDDELSKYFPKFNYPGVTIRSLLNHRSGLPNYLYFMEDLGWDVSHRLTNADMASWLIQNKAFIQNIAPPNTKFTYCNTNYALLALLIRVVSGEPYEQYIARHLFAPLGMRHSFVYTPADSARAVPSYDWKGRLMPFNYLDEVYGDKNIYSTVRDLFIWDRALSSGLLLNENTLLQAYSPYSNERPGVKNYGLGWRINLYPNGKKIIYHNGWWHGNNAVLIRLLEEDATIIVTGNKFTRAIYAARQLANAFGEYNIPEEEDTENDKNKTDTLPLTPKTDSLLLRKKPMTKKDSMVKRLFQDQHREDMIRKSKQL